MTLPIKKWRRLNLSSTKQTQVEQLDALFKIKNHGMAVDKPADAESA